MGHYDSSREGYCAGCGAAPGNLVNGKCPFCESRRNLLKKHHEEKSAQPKLVKVKDNKPSDEEYKKALDIVKRYEKNK